MNLITENSQITIPNSFYYFGNFEHIKDIPLYRITTPKLDYRNTDKRKYPISIIVLYKFYRSTFNFYTGILRKITLSYGKITKLYFLWNLYEKRLCLSC